MSSSAGTTPSAGITTAGAIAGRRGIITGVIIIAGTAVAA
jgi:hypothetical protein